MSDTATVTRPSYWNNTGRLQKEYEALYEQHVPTSGECATLAGEVLRASSRIYYDAFNNGFCNNTSGAWNFLDKYVPSKAMHEALDVLADCVNQSCNDVWMQRHDENVDLHPIEQALETIAEEATRFAMSDFAQNEVAPCDLFDLQDADDNSAWDEEEDDEGRWR